MSSDRKLVNGRTLATLAADPASRQRFGPDTQAPFLCIDLGECGNEHSQFLRNLPCPVIGVGAGALSDACDVVLCDEKSLAQIIENIAKAPIAAMTLAQLLRVSETLSTEDALTAESFAYAVVQKGPEFKRWLSGYTVNTATERLTTPPVVIDSQNGRISLLLNRPSSRNTINIEMRDALCEALDLALTDPSVERIHLTGEGACFCSGGAVDEFGEAPDPATAHWVRSLRLPAWRLARLKDRLEIHVNGAAIGAGAEIAAFGNRVTAAPKAWFQLPELKYGLIPGAGGCASLPRRIGRQRTAYMALSMARIPAATALEWGLVDVIES